MSAKQWSLVLVLGLAGAAGVWSVQAQDEEAGPYDNQIQYRQALMKSMGGHVAASASLLTGKIQADGQLKNHATAIAGIVSDDITKYFPEGSTDEDSAAEPEIWDNWDTFEKRMHENHDAAVAYNKVVQSGANNADSLAAFKKLTDTCKNCHEDYRHKD